VSLAAATSRRPGPWATHQYGHPAQTQAIRSKIRTLSVGAKQAKATMLAVLVCLGLSGCVVRTSHVNGEVASTRLLGFVKIDTYEDQGLQVTRNTLATVGLRVGEQSGLGFFSESTLSIPLDCRVVVLVTSDSQLEAVRRFMQDPTRGTELCLQKTE
jgi:hypothetical protein